ncbi:class I SAM-dependent methyltransferase [Mucilaginibacter boryungensis]|uniref:Class I SAM-dependent methyltransferase n=1 Tax=Mucilaginibacter boryungensis TaxID=768480 RepID=A0ABR9XHC5_9SPHI|nr:class I SAM-dependent methyltransferase [Mucilaginibacter boryungensis]MBE9666783.1 class I SAM-dependent methyltransferase [Mucilaginibacter boryungensis]
MTNNLKDLHGNIDIYLFDQLLKGRFDNCQTILDAGCGGGRNLHYFMSNGFNVYGIDADANAIAAVQQLSARLAPGNPVNNFVVSGLEDLPYTDNSFALVICSGVLHFATDDDHFDTMLRSMWRVLKPGGFFFARLASSIGIETLIKPLGNSRYYLPDGSIRYLVNEEALLKYTTELGGELFEPIKTTNVQNLRCMTTWCVIKSR